MIGTTVYNRKYKGFGDEAIDRFMEFTGLRCDVSVVRDEDNAFEEKLRISEKYSDQQVVFFDCDLWFLKPVNLGPLDRKGFFAVHEKLALTTSFDREMFKYDIENRYQYFNSGFMVWSPDYQGVFRAARERMGHFGNNAPLFDQSPINWALERSKRSFRSLKHSYNYCPLAVREHCQVELKSPHTIHAAGWKKERKAEVLNYYAVKCGGAVDDSGHYTWPEESRRVS